MHVLWAIALAILTGIVAAGVWALVAALWRRRRISKDVAPLRGRYTSTRKLATDPEDEAIFIGVRENVLDVVFEQQPEGVSIEGTITMDEQNLSRGSGSYSHVVDGRDYWGFWDVHVKDDNTLLVHTSFVEATNGLLRTTANVWRRWDT